MNTNLMIFPKFISMNLRSFSVLKNENCLAIKYWYKCYFCKVYGGRESSRVLKLALNLSIIIWLVL